MELCNDCGRLAKERGLANVFVSKGYMTTEAIDFASDWLDGINVDLKAFSEDYYSRLCKARLQPVLDTIEYIAKETKIWMEITTLLVPGENAEGAGPQTWPPLPLLPSSGWRPSRSRPFYPQYQM